MRLLGPFRPTAGGKVKAVLEPIEVAVLRGVPGMLRPIIEGDFSGQPEAERLLPPASRDDPKVAAAFRAMVQDQLVQAKLDAIDRFEDALADPRAGDSSRKWVRELDGEATATWLSVLNDARLVIGTRLGVTEEMYLDPGPEILEDPEHNLYFALSELLELLVEAASIAAGRGSVRVTREDVDGYEV